MISIAIVYIGLPRHEQLGRKNHKLLTDSLSKKFNVVEYNFLQPRLDRKECPFSSNDKGAARIQIWDFYTALDSVKEQIVIKIRSDVWFAKSSIQPIIDEVESIVNGDQDISYIGMDVIYNPSATNLKLPCANLKVPDLVIIADRTKIIDKTIIFNELQKGKLANFSSGNSTWRSIWKNKSRAKVMFCQVYLIRKDHNDYPSDREVVKDFINSYPNMHEASRWVDSDKIADK